MDPAVTANTVITTNVAPKLPRIKFLTFNTWGLKHVSKHRKARLRAIADKLAGERLSTIRIPGLHDTTDTFNITDDVNATMNTEEIEVETDTEPEDYDIVALQEIWCKEDWEYIVFRCKRRFPYYRIFYAGIISGPGLAILSKIPIESSFLYRFPINGRPSAFFRGDWYVGKSVSVTVLRPVTPDTYPLVILNSHMHAPYALQGDASYNCHRACQAWDFSRLARLYRQAGYAVIIVGDLNSRPGSLPHKFLTLETGLEDSWLQLHGEQDIVQIAKMNSIEQLRMGCTTCDSVLNTWRSYLGPNHACRLDYALIDPEKLRAVDAGVRFTERIPGVGSFSDHFAYSCVLEVQAKTDRNHLAVPDENESRDILLKRFAAYEEMLSLLHEYMQTAQRQKFFRGLHFFVSLLLVIAFVVVVPFTSRKSSWSSLFWVVSAGVISITGILDGLIAFLFGKSEIRALTEVELEVLDAQRALQSVLEMNKGGN